MPGRQWKDSRKATHPWICRLSVIDRWFVSRAGGPAV
jgi:hypothetical protein